MKIYKLIMALTLFFLSLILIQCSNESGFEPSDMSTVSNEVISSQKINLPNNKYAKVFYTKRVIEIDGNEKDWKNAPKRKMRQYIDVTGPIDDKFDLSSYFKILWDDNNLYVFARIFDDEINVNGAELFERDGFEIYLDPDNSKNPGVPDVFPPPAYEPNDDFIRFIPGETTPFSTWGIYDVSNYEFTILENSIGWTIEIKMPFSDLPDFPAEPGHVFGLEFQVNDNDQDQRQNFVKWNSPIDESFFDPSLFGSAYLFKSNGK